MASTITEFLSAFAKQFVQSTKEDCLVKMILIGERWLRREVGSIASVVTGREMANAWRTGSLKPSSDLKNKGRWSAAIG